MLNVKAHLLGCFLLSVSCSSSHLANAGFFARSASIPKFSAPKRFNTIRPAQTKVSRNWNLKNGVSNFGARKTVTKSTDFYGTKTTKTMIGNGSNLRTITTQKGQQINSVEKTKGMGTNQSANFKVQHRDDRGNISNFKGVSRGVGDNKVTQGNIAVRLSSGTVATGKFSTQGAGNSATSTAHLQGDGIRVNAQARGTGVNSTALTSTTYRDQHGNLVSMQAASHGIGNKQVTVTNTRVGMADGNSSAIQTHVATGSGANQRTLFQSTTASHTTATGTTAHVTTSTLPNQQSVRQVTTTNYPYQQPPTRKAAAAPQSTQTYQQPAAIQGTAATAPQTARVVDDPRMPPTYQPAAQGTTPAAKSQQTYVPSPKRPAPKDSDYLL